MLALICFIFIIIIIIKKTIRVKNKTKTKTKAMQMADSISHHKTLSKELNQSRGPPKSITDANKFNSLSRILSKCFLFLLFIVVIPLFPSQASNFITESLLSKSWGLLHLIIIGLALSYVLFCRRNFEVDFEQSTNFDDSQSSLVSWIFHVCPNFEDGYKNSGVGYEQIVHQSRDSPENGFKDDDFDNVTIGSFDRSVEPEGDFEISLEDGQIGEIRAWNYGYLPGESMVVMSKESIELDGEGKSGPVLNYKSLGSPLRSLNSGIVNPVGPHFCDGGKSDSSLKEGSSGSSERRVIEKAFGDMGPKNQEGKFNEVQVSSSQIPEPLRTGRVEPRGKVGSGGTNSSHFRPPSIDETQFESLKSQSLWCTTSLSSRASSMLHSPTRLSQSSSVSSEANSETEELGKNKSFGASNPLVSKYPLNTINGEAPLNAFHLRRYSNGSLFSKNVQVSSRDKLKVSSGSRRDDSLGNRERQRGSEKPDVKPGIKASSKVKSVRTMQYSQYPIDSLMMGDLIKSQADFEFGTSIEVKSAKLMKDEAKRDRVGLLSSETSKRNVDPRHHDPKPVDEGYQKKERTTYHENATAETDKDSQSEAESFQLTPGGDDVTETMRDLGCDSNEVDRRAGEFIAKFREQIMLQKLTSVGRSRQRHMVANHLR